VNHRRLSFLSLVLAGVALAGIGPVRAAESAPSRVLHLGPIPLAAADAVDGALAPSQELVCEIDPSRVVPAAGEAVRLGPGRPLRWKEVAFPPVVLETEGVHWIAVDLECSRHGNYRWEVESEGKATLFVDGERTEPGPTTLGRGRYHILLRVETAAAGKGDEDDEGPLKLAVSGDEAEGLRWSLKPRWPPARYGRMRELVRISSVAVSEGGRFVARVLSRRAPTGDGRESIFGILSRQGEVVVSGPRGDSLRPLFFTDHGKELVLRRPGSGGVDLLAWPVSGGSPRILVRGERRLSLVRSSADGQTLLLVSAEGAKPEEPAPDDPIHQAQLRVSIPDYEPGDILHLLDVRSGTRRQLTLPGDCVIEDAIWMPEGGGVLYIRTLPWAERPWFVSEIRGLDLATGRDSLVHRFVAGWEVRPDDLALSPDGRELAFTGPPEEIGPGHAEHNVYNRSLYLLDLTTGERRRIRLEEGWSFNATHDFHALRWLDRDTLLAVVDAGSSQELVKILRGRKKWQARSLPTAGEIFGAVAFSEDLSAAAYVGMGRDLPPKLHLFDLLRERDLPLETPNRSLPWILAHPQDASFRGEGGETIDAWWYPPSGFPGEGPAPLIVYYYGGASPTLRAFNTTHQWLCANGYALLVINPRGAYGWGDAFADCHAGDWGPKASADILRGVEVFLTAHPSIDAGHVGIYGGSYGGFMTAYLLTRTDRFTAAVDYYGISDITSYWGQGSWGPTYGDMSVGGRHPWDDRELFVDRSPIFQADRITTPLLLLHGLADNNVRSGESRQLFTALKMQGRPVEMVLFPGENHGIASTFSVQTTQREMMLDWFDRWLRELPRAWEDRWETGE